MKTTPKIPFPKKTLFAHRGASALAPENTLAAFQKAYDLNVPYLEFDIQQCLTGEWVIFHDHTLDRTTSGCGSLHEKSLKTLKALDAGSWFSPEFQGEPIPTLKEVSDWMLKFNVFANIELKTQRTPSREALQDILALVQPIEGQVIFSSFHIGTLQELRKLTPLPIGYIVVTPKKDDITLIVNEGWNSFHIQYDQIEASILQQAHDKDIPVLAYTVNDKNTLQALYDRGISGIFSDLTKDVLSA